MPVIVHIRDAFDDAFDTMHEVGVSAGGVVHCFTGGVNVDEHSTGLHRPISGIVTFKNARALRRCTDDS